MSMWNQLKRRATDTLWRAVGGGDRVPVSRGAAPAEVLEPRNVFPPAVDVLEGRDDLLVVADVPGAGRVDTAVSHDDAGVLVLRARVALEVEGTPLVMEIPPGGWYLRLELPSGFAGSRARARLRGGVLTITVPREEKGSRARRIPVQARA